MFVQPKLCGTGSYPAFANGWHRNNLHPASSDPRAAPCCSTACMAYSEQVGTKRQAFGSDGEIHRL